MKNKIKYLIAIVAFLGLTSCEDEQDLNFLTPEGTFSIVTPISGESIVLNDANPSNPGLSVTWSAMDFGTPTEITYSVELAPAGSDFANAQVLASTTNRFATIQTAQFNLACLTAGATPFVASPVDIRIKATIGTGSTPVYSSILTYTVTCYGCLGQFAVGAGLPAAGWNWDSPVSLICDDNVLTTTVTFANDAFRFFTQEGNWDSGRNYPYYTNLGYKVSSVLVNAMDGDSNFRFTGTPGVHRIKIDENQKFISVAQGNSAANSLWLVGAATPGGWSWAGNNETEFPLIKTGVNEAILTLNSGEAFRVFLGNNGGDSWGLGDRNYPFYVTNGYTISPELINALDGDSNFRYVGPTAVRVLKIDTVAKTITLN
jgi:hypothetical protein